MVRIRPNVAPRSPGELGGAGGGMPRRAWHARRVPRLLPTDADDPRLARLLQLYIYDWSRLLPIALGADGLFTYEELPRYRDRDGHAAFLFVDDDGARPLGFALALRDGD